MTERSAYVNCDNAGTCSCNCCDKVKNRHCYQHRNRCHYNCTPRY